MGRLLGIAVLVASCGRTGFAPPSGAAGGDESASVVVAALTLIASSPVVVGHVDNATVTARDVDGLPVVAYRGTVAISSTDPAATLPEALVFGAVDRGVRDFDVVLNTPGVHTLTVSDGTFSANQSGIVVNPLSATERLRVTGVVSPAEAGDEHTVTVEALDANDQVDTHYVSTVVFSSSAAGAQLPAPYTFVPADAGVHTFAVTWTTVGTHSLTVSDGSASGEVRDIVIESGPAAVLHLAVYGLLAGSTTVGGAHDVDVIVEDDYANRATGYTGTVTFISSDIRAVLPVPHTFVAGDAGKLELADALVFDTAGAQTLTVGDGSLTAEVQIEVVPPATRVAVVRSVGGGGVLIDGVSGNNSVTIIGGELSLHSVLPSHVGVGDALVYDSDDDGVRDAVAFLAVRSPGDPWKVVGPHGEVPADADGDQDWRVVRAYVELEDALSGLENPLIDIADSNFDPGHRDLYSHNEVWQLVLYADSPHLPAAISGWAGDGSSGNCLHIEAATEAAPLPQAHAGAWDDTAVTLVGAVGVNITDGCVRLRGLQIWVDGGVPAINIGTDAELDVSVNGCILRGDTVAAAGIRVDGGATVRLANNVIYGFDNGITIGPFQRAVTSSFIIANNTVDANTGGIFISAGEDSGILVNNLVQGPAADYNLGALPNWDVAANIADDDSSPNAGFDHQFPQFRDSAAGDFRLAFEDPSAVDLGVPVSDDEGLLVDVEGQRRVGAWNIGADQRVTRLWRSVGPANELPLALGGVANTLEVSNGLATLTGTVPDRVGVGDVFLYDLEGTGEIVARAIIHARIGSSGNEFLVADVLGGRPENTVAVSQDWQLYRAYTSLTDAEGGYENSGIPSALRNFDTWEGGRNLVENNEQWNIALYGDAADTGPVDINRWTTSRSNGLRIYTPVGPSEVGESQRHTGTWTPGAYTLVNTDTDWSAIYIGGPRVELDGLQIDVATDRDLASASAIGFLAPPSVTVTNSILRSTGPGTATDDDAGIAMSGWGHNTLFFARNNIIDGFGIGIASRTTNGWFHGAIDNNTIVNCGAGIVFREYSAANHDLLLRNNLVQGGAPDYEIEFTPVTAANLSQDDTSPDVGFRNATAVFVGAGNYHLGPGDAAAQDQGVDLSFDARASFGDDIDGEARTGAWCIGADEL